jgi:anhydro-N-acetylmuramic acid kinase
MRTAKEELYVGLMSGTSVDGIDAVLVSFNAEAGRLPCRLIGETSQVASLKIHAKHAHPFPPQWRELTLALGQGLQLVDLDQLGQLDQALADAFADAALAVLAKAKLAPAAVRAIGSHGQTIRHRPNLNPGFSLQIACPHRISERTGITVVADFRRRDVAAGGQGAPLVPAFHAAIFKHSDLVLNLGGISNISILGDNPHGFDIGPANALMDHHVQLVLGKTCDANGDWARSGTLVQPLLELMLGDPYFQKPAPKSTGREAFNWAWVERHLSALATTVTAPDLQATLTELVAKSVSMVIAQCPQGDLWVCGGGVHNSYLMQRLQQLSGRKVQSTAMMGVDPDYMEAMAFAWLARETLAHRTGNLPAVTGAAAKRVLGCIVPGIAGL